MSATIIERSVTQASEPALHTAAAAGPSPYAWVEQLGKRRILSTKYYLIAKRAMDIAICLVALPFLLPLFAVIALLIKLESPGAPAVFTQHRTGRHGRRFKIYKFRTMVANAEEMKLQLLHLNELQWPDFKITNDPRVTKIGKFLRKTSLDELPQIFNILKGDMSFVGPRPTSFAASTYRLWQTERLDVIPGLTGLWQVYGRAETEFDERLRQDIAYIQNRSLLFDIVIIFLTVGAVFMARGK
jgi:lipopolysaccharide/colanic/teichoic acid biosynthesis glycosyltransferase